LVEVLVTIVILCLGLMGSVALQASALQANAQTRHQVVSAALASELAEIMRGNHRVALNKDASANPYLVDVTAGSLTAPAVDCRTGACTGASDTDRYNAASWQMYEWLQRAMQELPSPHIVVCFDSTPFDTGTGLGEWECDGLGNAVVAKLSWTSRDTTGTLSFNADHPATVIPVTAGSEE